MKRQSGNWGCGGGRPARQAVSLCGWWHRDACSSRIPSKPPMERHRNCSSTQRGGKDCIYRLTFPHVFLFVLRTRCEWWAARCVLVSWVVNSFQRLLTSRWEPLLSRAICRQRKWGSQRLKSFVIGPQSDVPIPAIRWPAQHPQWVMGNV